MIFTNNTNAFLFYACSMVIATLLHIEIYELEIQSMLDPVQLFLGGVMSLSAACLSGIIVLLVFVDSLHELKGKGKMSNKKLYLISTGIIIASALILLQTVAVAALDTFGLSFVAFSIITAQSILTKVMIDFASEQ